MEWLDQVIKGAQLHGFYGTVHQVVSAHHEHDGVGIRLLHTTQHFYAVNAGKNDVEQSEIRFILNKYFRSLFAGCCRAHVKTFLPQGTRDSA